VCSICSHYCDEFLYSALFARKMDIARTMELIEHNWQWRVANGFEEIPPMDDLDWEFSKTNMMIPGTRTKDGHGIVYWQIKESDPGALDVSKIMRWAAWFYLSPGTMVGMDVARNGAFLIQDLDGLGWRHIDIKFQKKIMELYQDNFPARLHQSIQLNSPYILKMMIGLLRPFVKKKMLDKFFIGSQGDILSFVDKDQLWENYGGNLKYDHPQWVDEVKGYHGWFLANEEEKKEKARKAQFERSGSGDEIEEEAGAPKKRHTKRRSSRKGKGKGKGHSASTHAKDANLSD